MLEEFKTKYKNILNNEFDIFFNSLKDNENKFIRFNSTRGFDYKSEFKESDIEKDNNFTNIYKIKNNKIDLKNTIGFQTGGFYIQNPSSMFPVKILAEKMPDNPIILDISAAPGGKTTALSEAIKRKGLIVANDISSSRMKFLNFNLEKYGAWNVKTICKDGRILNKIYNECFDGILLDAPCSNENKILKDSKVASNWNEDFVKRMQKLQKELISSAFSILKPGGYLIYSTCTFSIEENEEIIEYILNNENAELININLNNFPFGLSGKNHIDESVIRVMPHKMPYDGFFIACIRKKGNLTNSVHFKNSQISKNDYFKLPFKNGYLNNIKNTLFFESKIKTDISYKKTGIKFGKIIKNHLELSSQAVWEFGYNLKEKYIIDINYDEALEYFKGNDINKTNNFKSAFAIFHNGLPVGTIKQVENRLKNKLDRFFLYGRNY